MHPIEREPSEENPSQDDRRFDLLVDGELGNAERRELLSSLDDRPGGWRRCAMAFLEAQAWRKDLGELGEIVRQPPAMTKTVAPTKDRRASRYLGTIMAMAACFLMAMFLGSWLRQQRHIQVPSGPAPFEVADATATLPGPALQQELPRESKPGEPLAGEPGPRELAAGEQTPTEAQRPDTPSGPWQMVTLDVPDGPGGKSESIRLPAIERQSVDQQWLKSFPAAVPADVLQALQQAGHQVQQRRQWVPMQMKDGRRLVVPVDEVDVHYMDGPAL